MTRLTAAGPTRRLRNRLMLAFAGFTLVVATLFGLYAVAFAYSVEDEFFAAMLEQEAVAQLAHRTRHGNWAEPRSPFMAVHTGTASLPGDIQALHRAEPWRSEFAGTRGRHYHVRPLDPPAPATRAWLVAEVSGQLVVRPIRDDIFGLLAWSALGVIVLALLLGYWLARRTTAPLADLADRVGQMRPGQLPEAFADRYPDDEVGVLARGVQSLIGRVREFIAREQEFTRDASHELRTPLAVIHSACERLAHDASLSVEARRQVDFLRQSVWQLQQTVTTLLTLAREGDAPLLAEAVVVLPMLERAVVEQAIVLEGKPVEVTVDVPRDARMTVPSMVLPIVLGNLVGNAFAHTAAGSVRIDVEDGRLRISNTDGMAGAVGDALYQPFVKGEASAGHGLGLAIVRRLCDRHGIDLRITTDARGTTASLALDGADADAAA